jgi:hypothetical protein
MATRTRSRRRPAARARRRPAPGPRELADLAEAAILVGRAICDEFRQRYPAEYAVWWEECSASAAELDRLAAFEAHLAALEARAADLEVGLRAAGPWPARAPEGRQ